MLVLSKLSMDILWTQHRNIKEKPGQVRVGLPNESYFKNMSF